MITETDLVCGTVDLLRGRLPRGWQTRVDREPRQGPGPWRTDATLTLHPPSGPSVTLAIIAKPKFGWNELARWVDRSVAEARLRADGVLLVAPYISPTARLKLIDRDASFADQTGNVRISLPQPPLFIELEGANRNPEQSTKALKSLRGRGSARAIRALCDFRPPYGIRGLAARAQVPAPSLSRVVDLLEREQLVTRSGPRGQVAEVSVRGVIERWTQDYEFSRANSIGIYLEPRGIPAFLDKLRTASFPYALTGSVASSLVAPAAPVRLASLYVGSPMDTRALGLRRVVAGGNVIVAEPFDPVVFERIMRREGLTLAAPSQVAADLLTGPGRSPGEAQELLGWMEANEDEWRL